MENKFKIAKFSKNDNSFLKDGFDEYLITYLKGTKIHQLRIVVNGFLTKQTINIVEGNSGYKNKILFGIKEYLEKGEDVKNKVTKRVTMSDLEKIYSKRVIHNVKTFLLPINKEESRDKLTEIGLINLKSEVSHQPIVIGSICTCMSFRETPIINGKYICSICNKPIAQADL